MVNAVEKVPFFTPVESTEKPLLPILKVFDYYLCFGDEVAVQVAGQDPIDGSRVCRKEVHATNCVATVLKIATYILSAGIFPLIALLVKAIARCAYQFHYAPEAIVHKQVEEENAPATAVFKGRIAPLVDLIPTNEPSVDTSEGEPVVETKPTLAARVDVGQTSEPVVENEPTPVPRVDASRKSEPVVETKPTQAPRVDAGPKSEQVVKEAPVETTRASLFTPPNQIYQKASFGNLESALITRQISREGGIVFNLGQDSDQIIRELLPVKAKAYFESMTLLMLQLVERNGSAYVDGKWTPLSEESLQGLRDLMTQKQDAIFMEIPPEMDAHLKLVYPHFENMELGDLEILLQAREVTIGQNTIDLKGDLLECLQNVIWHKARAYFESKDLQELESIERSRRAMIGFKETDLSETSIEAIQGLLIEMKKAAAPTETIKPDEAIELEEAAPSTLSPEETERPIDPPSALTPEAIAALQNLSFQELEASVRANFPGILSASFNPNEEAEQFVKELLSAKAKAFFQNKPLEILELAVKFERTAVGVAIGDQMILLSPPSLDSVFDLIRAKAKSNFQEESIEKLETIVKERKAVVNYIQIDLSNESLKAIRELIEEKKNAVSPDEEIEQPAPVQPVSAELIEAFENLSIGELQGALKEGYCRVLDDYHDLNDESRQLIERALFAKVKAYFQEEGFEILESAMSDPIRIVDGRVLQLNAISLQAIRSLIPARAKVYFEEESLQRLETILAEGTAVINTLRVTCSDESKEAIRALIADKRNAAASVEEIESDDDIYQNQSLRELEKALADDSNLSREAKQCIEGLIPAKAKAHFQGMSFETLDYALQSRAAYINERWMHLSPISLNVIRELLPAKAKARFERESLETLETITRELTIYVKGRPTDLTEISMQAIRELIEEKKNPIASNAKIELDEDIYGNEPEVEFNSFPMKTYYKDASLEILEAMVKDRKVYIIEREMDLGEDSLQQIRELISEKVNEQFKNHTLAQLETMLKHKRAPFLAGSVLLGEVTLLAVQGLIENKVKALLQNSTLEELEEMVKNESIDDGSNTIGLSAVAITAIKTLIPAKVRELLRDWSLADLIFAAQNGIAVYPGLRTRVVNLRGDSLAVVREMIQEMKAK